MALSAVVALAASLVLAAAPVSAAPTPYGSNLVKNPGAQAGSGGSVPSWDVDGNFASRAYGSTGMPSTSHGNSIGGGSRLFSSGAYDANFDVCGSATQFIKIKNRGGAIDGGNVRVTLKARLGTLSTATTARVTLQFREASNGNPVGNQMTLGPVSTNKTLVSRSKSRIVPGGAREFRIQLLSGDTVSTCDGFFDLVSVKISAA